MKTTAPSSATAPPIRNEDRHPQWLAAKGITTAASAPPSGRPACRMPIAKPRCALSNHCATDLLPPGWAVLYPAPTTTRNSRIAP